MPRVIISIIHKTNDFKALAVLHRRDNVGVFGQTPAGGCRALATGTALEQLPNECPRTN